MRDSKWFRPSEGEITRLHMAHDSEMSLRKESGDRKFRQRAEHEKWH